VTVPRFGKGLAKPKRRPWVSSSRRTESFGCVSTTLFATTAISPPALILIIKPSINPTPSYGIVNTTMNGVNVKTRQEGGVSHSLNSLNFSFVNAEIRIGNY